MRGRRLILGCCLALLAGLFIAVGGCTHHSPYCNGCSTCSARPLDKYFGILHDPSCNSYCSDCIPCCRVDHPCLACWKNCCIYQWWLMNRRRPPGAYCPPSTSCEWPTICSSCASPVLKSPAPPPATQKWTLPPPTEVRPKPKPMPKPPKGKKDYELEIPPAPKKPEPPAPGAEIPKQPELRISKIGPPRRHVGKTVEHEIEIRNEGRSTATNVKVVDHLPPELKMASTPKDAEIKGNDVVWRLGDLPPNESKKIIVRTQAAQVAPRVFNRATVSSGDGAGATASIAMEIVGSPGVLLEVFDLMDPVEEGRETEYLIRVTNQGEVKLKELRVKADCPAELKPIAVAGGPGIVVAGQSVSPPAFELNPGESRTYRLKAQAVQAASTRVKVSLTGANLEGPVVEEESTTVYAPNGSARPVAVK